MKFKNKNRAPLAHSNLTKHENMRSHYDPNGSWTGTPDGWDKTSDYSAPKDEGSRDTESGSDVFGFVPTHETPDFEREFSNDDVEAGREYPLEGEVAPTDGDSYSQNTRDMQSHDYPDGMNGNNMAEAGGDIYTPRVQGENGEREKREISHLAPSRDDVYDGDEAMDVEAGKDISCSDDEYDCDCGKYDNASQAYSSNSEHDISHKSDDVESGDDIYKNDIEFDPSKYESGEWKKPVEEIPAPSHDVEIATDFYALGDVGMPAATNGYPSVPDGELTMDQAEIKQDVTPVQDADDL